VTRGKIENQGLGLKGLEKTLVLKKKKAFVHVSPSSSSCYRHHFTASPSPCRRRCPFC